MVADNRTSTLLVCALNAEGETLSALKKQVEDGKAIVRVTGVGDHAVRSSTASLPVPSVAAVISWGVCGALNAQLSPGDLVLPSKVMGETGEVYTCDLSWRDDLHHAFKEADSSLKVLTGSLINSNEVVTDAAAKLALQQRSNADVVDMESLAVARFARTHNIPFIVVRAVSDGASHSLPKAAMLPAGQSDVSLSTVFRALSRPMQWPALIRTARQFKQGLSSLSRAAQMLPNDILLNNADLITAQRVNRVVK